MVPSTYAHMAETDLQKLGINVVIYANQLLRAAYPAMQNVANKILKHGRSKEVDNELISIKKILELIPGSR